MGPLRNDVAPVLREYELREMLWIGGGNDYTGGCASKRECLSGENHVDVEILGVGCWSPLLPSLGPKLRGESQRFIRKWEIAVRRR